MRTRTPLLPGNPTLSASALALIALGVGSVAVVAAAGYRVMTGSPAGSVPLVALRLVDTPIVRPGLSPPEPEPVVVDSVGSVVGDPVVVAPVSDPSPTFDGRPLRPVRTLSMKVTAYSPDARSCGKWADGFTASGKSVWTNGMKLVAADTKHLPFGSIITVPGYHGGKPVPVLDRGGKIKGHRLDVLYPTHEIALRWGVQDLEVTVWEYAD